MYNIDAYLTSGPKAIITPLSVSRDWMEENKWAFNCFPVALVNKLGFGIAFDKDISFIWNGNTNPGPDAGIKVIEGEENCYFGRGGGVIGFPTNLIFHTDQDVSLLTFPVPNSFIDGFQAFSSILTTSFYTGAFHAVGKVTRANEIITIKAGTPVVSVIPISLSSLQGTTVTIKKSQYSDIKHGEDYVNALTAYGDQHKRPAMWFQKEVDHNDIKIGSHEVSNIKLFVNDEK